MKFVKDNMYHLALRWDVPGGHSGLSGDGVVHLSRPRHSGGRRHDQGIKRGGGGAMERLRGHISVEQTSNVRRCLKMIA